MPLPNLLADQPQLSKFIQSDMTPEDLGQELLALLEDTQRVFGMVEQFSRIHAALRRDVCRVLQVAGWGAQHDQ